MNKLTIRRLTAEERHTWGTCPVCGAPHGEPCKDAWRDEDGNLMGAHVIRLAVAPVYAPEEGDEEAK